MTASSEDPPDPGADALGSDPLDRRLHEDRPMLGSARAALKARVVASVVHKQPRVAGRYVLGRTIGSGNFGTVFEARDPELDRRVAVKIVPVRSASQRTRVVREARLLASLSHPNVVSVFEVGLTDDEPPSPYVVMELVEGQTLRAWFDQGPRPWREVVAVILQAARGLESAHRAGIVHGDFKPDNVLLGSDGRARVVDFGLARFIGEDDPTDQTGPPDRDPLQTPMGGGGGTPAYMAPEAFGGEVSPRVDQYSLCVTLYEGLFGERPVSATTVETLLEALHRHEPSLPRERRDVPPAIGAAVLRGLAPRPEDRFADLGALAAALEQGRRPRRRWAGLGAAVAVGGLAATGVALATAPSSAPAPELAGADAGLGSGPDPEPAVAPSLAPALARLEADVAELRTLVATAKLAAAQERSAALVEQARALEHEPALVEPLLLRGRTLMLATDYEGALPVLEEAYFLAGDHGQPALAAEAASELISLLGFHTDNYDDAHRWQDHAEVAFERAGLDPRHSVAYMTGVAGLKSRETDIEGAIEVLREIVEHVEHSEQAGSSAHASVLRQLARELYYHGDAEQALEIHQRVPPMLAATDGVESITYAGAVDNLGVYLAHFDRLEESLAKHREALRIREAILGPDHIDLARSYSNTGQALGRLGRHEEAFRYLDRSIELFSDRLGPGNATVGMGHELKGVIHEQRGPEGREDALREYATAARIYDGAGVIYAPTAERARAAIEALGGTPPPRPSVPLPPEP